MNQALICFILGGINYTGYGALFVSLNEPKNKLDSNTRLDKSLGGVSFVDSVTSVLDYKV